MNPPAIYSSPKKPEFLGLNAILDAQKAKSLPSSIPVEETGCLKPIVLKPKMYWKIMSKHTITEAKVAVRKKYLKSKISYLFKRYIIIKNKKYLKNSIDFINLVKFKSLASPVKYWEFITFIVVDKKITKKNKKIIFIDRSYLVVRIFDFK